jgi:hypothetical protein
MARFLCLFLSVTVIAAAALSSPLNNDNDKQQVNNAFFHRFRMR